MKNLIIAIIAVLSCSCQKENVKPSEPKKDYRYISAYFTNDDTFRIENYYIYRYCAERGQTVWFSISRNDYKWADTFKYLIVSDGETSLNNHKVTDTNGRIECKFKVR